MIGAFRPSAPLSGGLLWKIPWRLSAPQKLRQRRRLRKIDNIVTVLSTALQNRAAESAAVAGTRTASSSMQSQPASAPNPQDGTSASKARAEDLKVTAEGRRILAAEQLSTQMSRRHGKGPKLGDFVPNAGYKERLLSDEARVNGTIRLLKRWKAEMPREEEMLPRDKYTIFDRKARGYRKGVHKLPKWTRVSQRLNPPGF